MREIKLPKPAKPRPPERVSKLMTSYLGAKAVQKKLSDDCYHVGYEFQSVPQAISFLQILGPIFHEFYPGWPKVDTIEGTTVWLFQFEDFPPARMIQHQLERSLYLEIKR